MTLLFGIEYHRYEEVFFISTIKDKRREKGLTQVELSQISGVSQATISAIESGTRKYTSYETLKRLATALDLPESHIGTIHAEMGM